MTVDEPYTVNEKYGTKHYEVGVFSPDFNGFITHETWKCKITNTKKIEKLRAEAVRYAKSHKEIDEIKWSKVE